MADIHITSIQELIAFGSGDYGYGTSEAPLEVYLDADLDFATDDNGAWKYYNWGGCTGTFYCNFDGQDHIIKNISYNGTAHWGFFAGNITGSILNLKLLELQAYTTAVVGAFVGNKNGGGEVAIRNCHATGNITSTGNRAAGIVGNRDGGGTGGFTLDFCTFAGVIRGSTVSGMANFSTVHSPNIVITCCNVRADLAASGECYTIMFGSGYYSSSYPGFVRKSCFIGTMSGNNLTAGYNLAGRCTEDYAVIKSANKGVTCRSELYDATVASAAGITVNGGTGETTEHLQSKQYLHDTYHWEM